MELTREQYNALEDVVGDEYISEEPVIRDTYCKVWGNRVMYGDEFAARPAAVALPGSTEEVQRIVRVCNRYKIAFKPSASLFMPGAQASSENAIVLDLRRMNRILELDAKNKHIVVEPYVSHMKAQIAAIKQGVYMGVVGLPHTSVVVSHCCYNGEGLTSVSTAAMARNVLGVEWVLPTGEILKLGTVGTGAGWFSADGPGMSLQGLMRGQWGAMGALGVVTKVAAKLYDWCGPETLNYVGDAANYVIDGELEGYDMYLITFPTVDDLFEFNYLIHEEQIVHNLVQASPSTHFIAMEEGNDEAWEAWQKNESKADADLFLRSVALGIGSRSDRQREFNDRVIKEVMQKTHGEIKPELNDPTRKIKSLVNTMFARYGIRAGFRIGQAFTGIGVGSESLDLCRRLENIGNQILQPYVDRGEVLQFRVHGQMANEHNTVGGRGKAYVEYDPLDPKSLQAAKEIPMKGPKDELYNFALPSFEETSTVTEYWGGTAMPNAGDWAGNIKWTFDPNNVSDGNNYPRPVPPIKHNA